MALSAAECLCHQVVCVGFGERFAPHQEAVAQRRGDGVDDKLWVDIGWYPDNVQIQLAAQTIAVSAEQLSGNAREQAWRHITSTAKRFAGYEQKTDRELPVIRLRARPNPKP